MDTEFLCGVITRKSTGKQEFFPIKVNSIIRRGVKTDLGLRSHLAREFAIKACKLIGIKSEDCQISILNPESETYKVFLDSLAKFSKLDLEKMAVDLSAFQYRSDA